MIYSISTLSTTMGKTSGTLGTLDLAEMGYNAIIKKLGEKLRAC